MKLGHSYSSHEPISNLQVSSQIFPPESFNHSPNLVDLEDSRLDCQGFAWSSGFCFNSIFLFWNYYWKSHQISSMSRSPKNILTWDFHPFPLSVPSQGNQACSKYLQLRPLTTDRWTTKWFWQVMRHHLETNLVFRLRLKHIEVVSVSWNLLFPKTNM